MLARRYKSISTSMLVHSRFTSFILVVKLQRGTSINYSCIKYTRYAYMYVCMHKLHICPHRQIYTIMFKSQILFFCVLPVFKVGSYVAQNELRLPRSWGWLAFSYWSLCPPHQNGGIAGMCHHAQLKFYFKNHLKGWDIGYPVLLCVFCNLNWCPWGKYLNFGNGM